MRSLRRSSDEALAAGAKSERIFAGQNDARNDTRLTPQLILCRVAGLGAPQVQRDLT
jgi:hypothetical protein